MENYFGKLVATKSFPTVMAPCAVGMADDSDVEDLVVLDHSLIESMRKFDGEDETDMVIDFIDSYLEYLPRQLSMLRSTIDEQNINEMWRAAHNLKGSSACLGLQRLSAICLELELLGRQGLVNGARELFAKLELEVLRARRALAEELSLIH